MNLIVKESRIGLGAFLTVPISQGGIIVDWSSHPLFERPPRILPEWRFNQISPGVFTGPIGPEEYPDAYINHSCEPNARILFHRPKIHLISLRDLVAGEEVTFDYATLYEPPFLMKCLCGAKTCRGIIRGLSSPGNR